MHPPARRQANSLLDEGPIGGTDPCIIDRLVTNCVALCVGEVSMEGGVPYASVRTSADMSGSAPLGQISKHAAVQK